MTSERAPAECDPSICATEVPAIPKPEKDDPDLRRTRLYPLWGAEDLYGEPQSPVEERRQELEWSRAEHYRREGDLQGEIDHYIGILAERPRDLGVIYYLGCTYLENGEPLKVIEVIGEAHRCYPRLLDFQELLLKALATLGRCESDYQWACEIRIVRLDQSVIDRCYAYLRRKRGPRFSDQLAEIFSGEGCLLFNGCELIEVLEEDSRFIVDGHQVRATHRSWLGRSLQRVAEEGRRAARGLRRAWWGSRGAFAGLGQASASNRARPYWEAPAEERCAEE